jgi:hypothetical protein
MEPNKDWAIRLLLKFKTNFLRTDYLVLSKFA